MGRMDDSVETLGVGSCNLSDFFMDLKGQLSLVSGLYPMPEGLTLASVRRPLLVIGKPGIGKTCGILSILNDLNKMLPKEKQFGMKKILLGQTIVGELSGIDVVNPATGELKKSQSPNLPRVKEDGEYGVLFLDEITTADEAQIQPALGLADDTRSIGEYTLPEHWVVVAAGNGPDCANFVKMDDMTLTRFQAYDIDYDYKTDWRPWAHENGIDELIIAYLNFAPEETVHVVSDDMSKSGKMFACPRTWTRLSDELKIRKAQGRPVSQEELYAFSSRIIGETSAKGFTAFAAYRSQVKYDAGKIIEGTEKIPQEDLPVEVFHILIMSIIKQLREILKSDINEQGLFSDKGYIATANALKWIMSLDRFKLDEVMNAITQLREEVPNIKSILVDPKFDPYCPEYLEFIMKHASAIQVM